MLIANTMRNRYNMPHSLYSGRARAYLINAGFLFRSCPPGNKAEALFKVGMPTMPALLMPQGDVISMKTCKLPTRYILLFVNS